MMVFGLIQSEVFHDLFSKREAMAKTTKSFQFYFFSPSYSVTAVECLVYACEVTSSILASLSCHLIHHRDLLRHDAPTLSRNHFSDGDG